MEPNQTETQPSTSQPPAVTDPNQLPPPPADTEVKLELTTLKELGPNLPVGFPNGTGRVRKFRLRPFRLKEEKELGAMREKNKAITFGEFVSGVLAKMVQTIGPHAFDSMKETERRAIISNLEMADVLYTYLYLRYEALGPEEPVVMRAHCPNCHNQFPYDADLGSLEVRTVPDDVQDLRRTYRLRDGMPIHGEDRHALYLHPLKWSTFERKDFASSNRGEKEVITVIGSIVGAEGCTLHPFQMADHELDEMTKYDLEGVTRDIEDNSPGPQMIVTSDCPHCRMTFNSMIDWTYDSFFSRFSPQSRGRI